jgi:hypothetical protein
MVYIYMMAEVCITKADVSQIFKNFFIKDGRGIWGSGPNGGDAMSRLYVYGQEDGPKLSFIFSSSGCSGNFSVSIRNVSK